MGCASHVPVAFKGAVGDATDPPQTVCETPQSVRQAGIHSLIRQRMQADLSPQARQPPTYTSDDWTGRAPGCADAGNVREEEEGREQSSAGTCKASHQLSQGSVRTSLPASSLEASATSCHERTCSGTAADTAQLKQTGCQLTGDVGLLTGANVCGAGRDDTCLPLETPVLLDRPKHSPVPPPGLSVADFKGAGSLMSPSKQLLAAAPSYTQAVYAQQQQQLTDAPGGSRMPMPFSHLLCLWAVKLVLPHPVTQKHLKLRIPDPPVFERVRSAEARLADDA